MTARRSGRDVAAGLAILLVLLSPLAVLAGAFGAVFGVWEANVGFDLVAMTIGWSLSWVGLAAALGLAALSLKRPRGWRPLVALIVLAVAGLTVGLFLHQRAAFAQGLPNDVSTSADDPPALSRPILDARVQAGAVEAGVPAGPSSCPGLAHAPTQVAPETAMYALKQAGFAVGGAAAFRADGSRDGFWFGFGHDAVVRIRPGRTDVRVTAREAHPDGGAACRLALKIVQGLTRP